MISKHTTLALFVALVLLFNGPTAEACSFYKVSTGEKTIVGCNEDAWRTDSKIWFKCATHEYPYGVCFTGSRRVRAGVFAPQSGMNEAGLVYSRLASHHDKQNEDTDKKPITDEVSYLEGILQKCKTIQEVRAFVNRYDRSIFLHDVFVYVDATGDYLVVEPYAFVEGSEASYVLSNFCPSQTSNQQARKLKRYRNGEDFIATNGIESTIEFCRAMSDTMHVCRNRNGDGTLLTSIWDIKAAKVNLYFYHSYDETVQFDIVEELSKGDHIIDIPSMFAKNPEFEHLQRYKTPFNVPVIRIFLVLAAGVLLMLSLFYLLSYFRKQKGRRLSLIKLVFSVLNVLLVGYLFVLATNMYIYYFDAPYTHYSSNLISASSYIPFILLLLIIPVLVYAFRYTQVNSAGRIMKSAMLLNSALCLLLMFGFGYWGLLHFWN